MTERPEERDSQEGRGFDLTEYYKRIDADPDVQRRRAAFDSQEHRMRTLTLHWNADIRKLVLLRESLPKYGLSKWGLRFYGLIFRNIGIGVIRQERLS